MLDSPIPLLRGAPEATAASSGGRGPSWGSAAPTSSHVEAATQGRPGDIEQLREEVVSLGGLVESMVIESADLLQRCDLDGLERLNEGLRQVREKRLSIEMGGLEWLATQPTRDAWPPLLRRAQESSGQEAGAASDPRGEAVRSSSQEARRCVSMWSAVATVEIAAELERVAEHAWQTARTNSLKLDQHLRQAATAIHRLATMLQAMLHQSVAAFAEGDIEGAEAALAAGQDVEIVYQQIHDQLLGIMERCPRSANQTLYLRRAAYHLNRATERVRAICRWVGYASTGIQQAASPD